MKTKLRQRIETFLDKKIPDKWRITQRQANSYGFNFFCWGFVFCVGMIFLNMYGSTWNHFLPFTTHEKIAIAYAALAGYYLTMAIHYLCKIIT